MRNPGPTVALALLAVALAAGCGSQEPPLEVPPALLRDVGPSAALRVEATVAWVVDGDTFDAQVGSDRMRVRLLGIDTPETVKPGSPVECFGPEASHRAKQLLPKGSRVWIETDVGGDRRDMYGRLLAYITPAGARSTLNATLLREGLADLYVFHPQQPFYRAAAFKAIRDRARAQRRGMWGVCPHPGRR